MKTKNGIYKKDVTFEQIVELYLFNSNFRQLIFPEIEKIEINVRCRIANYFAETYGVLGYLEAENFVRIMKKVNCQYMLLWKFLVSGLCQSSIRI